MPNLPGPPPNDPGSIIRFQITDSAGGVLTSKWMSVWADPVATTSSVSVVSTASVASALSTQAYISRLSASAQFASYTGSPGLTSTSQPERQNFAPIIGGILGGVAVLLASALVIFWRLRRAYPRPNSRESEYTAVERSSEQYDPMKIVPYGGATTGDGSTYGGWGLNATDQASSMAQVSVPYNPYQTQHSPPIISTVPSSTIRAQTPVQPPYGSYGGLPEIQGGHH
ncbi:hypothetical protein FRC09_009345 [Ceratobasidium sp. 395]|nr:hypothetical protein FRC09_009345 [Ceratobasidium sp. 395]